MTDGNDVTEASGAPAAGLAVVHDAALDPWQFHLSREPASGRLILRVGPEIEAVDLADARGRPMGVVLGFPISMSRKLLLSQHYILETPFDGDMDRFAAAALEDIAGRYLLILSADGTERIYLDCAGLVSCVFDATARVAASTAHAMLDDAAYDARFRASLFDRLRVRREGWFPGGLTAHEGVERLLPNHYLDLMDWTARRHWYEPHASARKEPSEIVAEINDILRCQLDAFVSGPKKPAVALTAGHETRMLLANARTRLEDLEFVTVVGRDRHAVDSQIARRIAQEQGLHHITLDRVEATEAQRDLFIRRGGHCVVDSNSIYAPSVLPIAQSHNFIGGLGGEVARAFLWQDEDTPDLSITPERLCNRFGLPQEPEVLAVFSDWLGRLETRNALEILDLAYIEHRMGPWSGGQFYNDPTLVRYAPIFTRRCTDLMLSLPPDLKRRQWMPNESVRQAWPELEVYPYNSIGWWPDVRAKIERVVDDPWIIIRKLRKMRR